MKEILTYHELLHWNNFFIFLSLIYSLILNNPV